MNKKQRTRLMRSFNNKSYRLGIANDNISLSLSSQIKYLRHQNGWTIKNLADATGLSVRTVKKIEDPKFGTPTLESLKKIADAFDIVLAVRFVPFSDLADWLNTTPERLAPPSFTNETRAAVRGKGSVIHWLSWRMTQCRFWAKGIIFN